MLAKFGINSLKADKEIRVKSGRIYKSGELSEVADRGGVILLDRHWRLITL